MSKELSLEEYERRLEKLVDEGRIKCSQCGNTRDFMVNEIGNIYCKKCHKKVPLIRLEDEPVEN